MSYDKLIPTMINMAECVCGYSVIAPQDAKAVQCIHCGRMIPCYKDKYTPLPNSLKR